MSNPKRQVALKALFILITAQFCCLVSMTSVAPITTFYPTSCKNLEEHQLSRDILQIQVGITSEPFYVKCNHLVDGGGWTVVLHRSDGTRNFSCKWKECVDGFGSSNQEFFVGLQQLYEMTASGLHELLFILEDFENDTRFAKYDAFAIKDASNDFTIHILGNYSGTAGDSFTYQAGNKFSAIDKDFTNTCVNILKSPGWFNLCSESNIFGPYLLNNDEDAFDRGMYWQSFHGNTYSLKKISMLIRPVE